MEKKWIVLIRKSPRGPFTFSEVCSLLSDKTLTVNDIAFLVPDRTISQKSEWKFLWQYAEFLSYKEGKDPQKEVEQISPAPINENEGLAKKIETLLPEELASILPEDLVVHETKKKEMRREDLPQSMPVYSPSLPTSSKTPTILGSIFGMCFLLFGMFYFGGSSEEPKNKQDIKIALPLERPAERAVSSSPLDNVRVKTPQVAAKPQVVKPVLGPTASDLSIEEYQRQRDERYAKERLEEEKKREAEQKAMETDEEEHEEKPKKKRRAASEDEMEMDVGEDMDQPVFRDRGEIPPP